MRNLIRVDDEVFDPKTGRLVAVRMRGNWYQFSEGIVGKREMEVIEPLVKKNAQLLAECDAAKKMV